jgi:chloramphenicol-sensitive protein RarD
MLVRYRCERDGSAAKSSRNEACSGVTATPAISTTGATLPTVPARRRVSSVDQRTASGVRSAVLAYSLWGSFTAYWKLLGGFAAAELIGWRVGSAVSVLWILVAARGRLRSVRTAVVRPDVRTHLLWAGVLLVVNWSTYVGAVISDRVIETALGYFLAPLITMGLGVGLLGERLTRLRMVAIALVAVAIVVLSASYGRLPWVAVLIGGSWSLYGLVKRRVDLDPIESLTGEVTLLAPIATLVIFVSFMRSGGVGETAQGLDWLLLLGTGIVTAAPLLLFAHAAPRVPFTLLGPIGWLVPVINLTLGWVVYNEDMPATRLGGFVLVWVALIIVAIETVLTRRRTVHAAMTVGSVR